MFKLRSLTEEQYSASLAHIASNAGVRMDTLNFDGMAGLRALYNRKNTDPEFKARFEAAKHGRRWGGREPVYTAGDYETALSLVKSIGHAAYRARSSSEGLPNACMLWERARRDRQYGYRYFASRVSPVKTKRTFPQEKLKTALSQNSLYARVDAAVPGGVDGREDVVSDMVEAVLSGALPEDEIETRRPEFVARYNREFSPSRFASTDAPRYDGNMINKITTDPAHFWGT